MANIRSANGSFFAFPAIRWSVVHMRQMLPTINVSRGLNAPTLLPYALDAAAIDALTFLPWGAKKPMTWKSPCGKTTRMACSSCTGEKSCTNAFSVN